MTRDTLTYTAAGATGATTAVLAWSVTSDVRGNTTTISSATGSGAGGTGRTQAFTYDPAGRLTGVVDTIGAGCITTRTYGFDLRGNRTSQATAASKQCGTATTTSKAWAYDSADRVQAGATIGTTRGAAYKYDNLGRQTTVPAVDTPSGGGDITLGYYDTDAARTLARAGVTTTYSLDPAGRRASETSTGTKADGTRVNEQTIRHYTDDSDNPGWAYKTGGGEPVTTWYGGSIGGDLGVQVTTTGTGTTAVTNVQVNLVDTLGSIATTINLPAGTAPVQLGAVGTYDEYGNTLTTGPATGVINYNWLGGKERATNNATGLVLMGARLYNSVTGLFTTIDPVPGGNTTAYTYPQDPINSQHLDGRWSWWKKHGKTLLGGLKLGLGIAAAFGCAVCGVASMAWAAYDVASARTWRERGVAALGFIPAGFGAAARGYRASMYARQALARKAGNYQLSRAFRARGNSVTHRILPRARHLDRAVTAYDAYAYGRETHRRYARRR